MSQPSVAESENKADEELSDDIRRRVVRLAVWHNANSMALVGYHMRTDLDVAQASAWIRWLRGSVRDFEADVALFGALPTDGVYDAALRRDFTQWNETIQRIANGTADRLCRQFGLQSDGSDPSRAIPHQRPPEHLLHIRRLGPETERVYKIASRVPLTEKELRYAWTAYRNNQHIDLTQPLLSRALGMIDAIDSLAEETRQPRKALVTKP